MFYTTTIKSVGQSGVIDVQGRRLNFIGHLPVKAGDTVYTDGRFIFGNAPPKGSPAIFDEPSGIPVLGEFDASGKDELRGYFTNRGKYKKYRIAGDDWITNDKKKYAHDDGENENIIDAEIVTDADGNEDEFTIEKIVGAWEVDIPSDEFKCSVSKSGARFGETSIDFTVKIANTGHNTVEFSTEKETWLRFITANKAEFVQKNGVVIKNCELVIKKNSEEFARLNFSDLIQESENRARNFISDFTVIGYPSEDEIETRAVLENFKIAADGHWEALIWIDVLAKRTFYAKNAATSVYVYFDYETERDVVPVEDFQFENPSIPESVYNRLNNLFGVQGIQTTTTTYTFREVDTSPKSYNSSVCTHHCFFVKLSSDTLNQETPSFEQETLFETMRYFPLYFIATELHHPLAGYATITEGFHYLFGYLSQLVPNYTIRLGDIEKNFDLPCKYPYVGRPDKGYPLTWYKYHSAFIGSSTEISTVKMVGAGETLYQGADGELYLAVLIFRVYNSQDWLNVTDIDLKTESVTGRYIDNNIGCDREDDFLFHVQDDFQAKIITPSDKSWLYDNTGLWNFDCRLNDIHDADDKSVIGDFLSDEENAQRWNMSLWQLTGDKYLFGVHGGKIYLKTKDGTEVVGDGVKNFRLRELKNIRKAKK